jgi:hypothetical protein
MRIAHYDAPPPDTVADIDALLAVDAIRFANQLNAWIEVDGGRIVDAAVNSIIAAAGLGLLLRKANAPLPVAFATAVVVALTLCWLHARYQLVRWTVEPRSQ